jgi:hypothetical protein
MAATTADLGSAMTRPLSFIVSETLVSPGNAFVGVTFLMPHVHTRSITAVLKRMEFAGGYATVVREAKVRIYANQHDATQQFLLQVPEDAVPSFQAAHGSVCWVITLRTRTWPWRRFEGSGRVYVGSHPDDTTYVEPEIVGGPTDFEGPPPQTPDKPIPKRLLFGLLALSFVLVSGCALLEKRHGSFSPPLIGISTVSNLAFFGLLYQTITQLQSLRWLRTLPRWFWRLTALAGAGISCAIAVIYQSGTLGTTAGVLALGVVTPFKKPPQAVRRQRTTT